MTSFETRALILVEQTDENLFAHVELDVPIGPGDRVRVHGAPVRVPFGESARIERTVTVERASWLRRQWTRLTGHFAMDELYEVSFSPGSIR